MKLEALLKDLSTLPSQSHICCSVGSPNLNSADFLVVGLNDEDDPIVPAGYREFLDVSQAQEIDRGLSMLDPDAPILERFITYIQNDA